MESLRLATETRHSRTVSELVGCLMEFYQLPLWVLVTEVKNQGVCCTYSLLRSLEINGSLTPMSVDLLMAYHRIFKVPVEWLLTGNLFESDNLSDENRPPTASFFSRQVVKRMKQRKGELNWSEEEFADMLQSEGMRWNASYIRLIERNATESSGRATFVSVDQLAVLAKILDKAPTWFLFETV